MTIHDLSLLESLDGATISKALAALRGESDRGAVLIAISILDSALSARISQLLKHGCETAKMRLLNRSFGSFASKVDFAYCVGMIPRALYDDIRLLNKLRNRCAHDWESFVVTDDVIAQYIQPMSIKRALDAGNAVSPVIFPPGTCPSVVLTKTLAALITLANLLKPQNGASGSNRAAMPDLS